MAAIVLSGSDRTNDGGGAGAGGSAAATLEPLVPASLALEQHDDRGFVAVALVDLDRLRPAALPRRRGIAARFVGYRTFVRAAAAGGRTRRGLKVLHTDVDGWPLVAGMRLLTRYRSAHADIGWRQDGDRLGVRVTSPRGRSDLGITATLAAVLEAPPPGSPFATWAPFAPATPRLAAAFRLQGLDYTWTAGTVEPLATPPG
jgi:hypothetical protein